MRHIVDYSQPGKEAAFALAGALGTPCQRRRLHLNNCPSLRPHRCRNLSDLVEQVSAPNPLTQEQQRQILTQLQPALRSADSEERHLDELLD